MWLTMNAEILSTLELFEVFLIIILYKNIGEELPSWTLQRSAKGVKLQKKSFNLNHAIYVDISSINKVLFYTDMT